MRIKNFQFIKSYGAAKAIAEENTLPEICVVGRSNVGKSSFINMMAGAAVARTSSSPGRTRLINRFDVKAVGEDGAPIEFAFIDLPGYGYAKVDKAEIERFSKLCDDYFRLSEKLMHAFVLVDCRRDPNDLDKTMVGYLAERRIPYTVVLSKIDKLSRNELNKQIIPIATALYTARDSVIKTSALKKIGKEDVLARMEQALKAEAE